MVRAICVGVVLGFAIIGVVATSMSWGGGLIISDTVETVSEVHNLIIFVRDPGYYHVRVWRTFDGWRARVFSIEEDREIPYDDGLLRMEPSI